MLNKFIQSHQIETSRLILEPIKKAYADEVFEHFQDPKLYEFIDTSPPQLSELKSRFARWEEGLSPGKNEIWHNWLARLKSDQNFVGHFQAGINERNESYIAFVLFVPYQKMGLALEGATAVCEFLRDEYLCESVWAWVDARNKPSLSLIHKLGLKKLATSKSASSTDFIFILRFNNNQEFSSTLT